MNNKIIKNENMLRIRDKKLLERLQEMFTLSNAKSTNEFFNSLLKNIAFKELKLDEILERIENMETTILAIWEKVRYYD